MITNALLANGLPPFRYTISSQRCAVNRDNAIWGGWPPVITTPANAYVAPRDAQMAYYEAKAGPYGQLEAYAEDRPTTLDRIAVAFEGGLPAQVSIVPTGQVIPAGTPFFWLHRNSRTTYEAKVETDVVNLALINKQVVSVDTTHRMTFVTGADTLADYAFLQVLPGTGPVTLVMTPPTGSRPVGVDLGDSFFIIPEMTCYLELELGPTGKYRPKRPISGQSEPNATAPSSYLGEEIPLETYWTEAIPNPGQLTRARALSQDGKVLAHGTFEYPTFEILTHDGTNWNVALTATERIYRLAISADGSVIVATLYYVPPGPSDPPGYIQRPQVATWLRSGSTWVKETAVIYTPQLPDWAPIEFKSWDPYGSQNEEQFFGIGLALSSDGLKLAIGNPAARDSGMVHIYERESNAWVLKETLVGLATSDQFGSALTFINGTTLAVGASEGRSLTIGDDKYHERYYSDLLAGIDMKPGSVSIFEKVGTTWLRKQVLTGLYPLEKFGWAVAASGDGTRLAVASYERSPRKVEPSKFVAHNWKYPPQGSVLVFKRQGETWVEESELQNGFIPLSISLSSDGQRLALVSRTRGYYPGEDYKQFTDRLNMEIYGHNETWEPLSRLVMVNRLPYGTSEGAPFPMTFYQGDYPCDLSDDGRVLACPWNPSPLVLRQL